MCHYCGCRQIPLIRDFIAEHEEISALGAKAVRELGRGEVDLAQADVDRMRDLLASHWRGEEDGVFVAMAAADELYADYIRPLEDEHRELGAFLAGIDLRRPEDVARFTRELDDLAEHIVREEDGLFPATLVTLSGPEWDASIAAWEAAHPGRTLRTD
ncbi:MAG: hemerythrin domain-containing protein [Nocardioides sp.]|uniref:hemerythrin domain-containing protein n=1 Tax=Nocardioides sp. TaxID=35761 RepID=UPI003F04B3D4